MAAPGPTPQATPARVQDAVMIVNASIQELAQNIEGMAKGGGGGGGGGLLGLKSAFAQASASLLLVTSAVQRFGSALGQFVGLFSPVAVQQFNFAARDMMAAIGEGLTPVMLAAIPFVRLIGDTFAGLVRALQPLIQGGIGVVSQLLSALANTLLSALGPVLQTMVPVWQMVFQTISQLIPVVQPLLGLLAQMGGVLLRFQAIIATGFLTGLRFAATLLAPLGELIAAVFQPMLEMTTLLLDVVRELFGVVVELAGELVGGIAVALKAVFGVLVEGVRVVAGMVKEFAAFVRDLFGIEQPKQFELGDSRGKAIASTGQTSVAGMLTKMQTSAFALGGANPAADTARNTQKTASLLDRMVKWTQDFNTKIVDVVRDGAAEVGTRVKDGLVEAFMAASPQNIIGSLLGGR